jgi:iron complex outermembrane receptor protein
MNKLLLLLLSLFIYCNLSFGQLPDSSNQLDTVILTAFYNRTPVEKIAAPVSLLTEKVLQQYDRISLLPAVNTQPGVRMEERSPGSYRLSIRGSLLRSPFGVRNIKVYIDDLPFTDASGNTYLNLIDINQLQSVEIIRGFSGSVYGAHTGGTVLLHLGLADTLSRHLRASVSGGSFGLLQAQAGWQDGTLQWGQSLHAGHTRSDGYRDNSSLKGSHLQWLSRFKAGPNTSIRSYVFLSDLLYRTPGGLTVSQADSLPTQSRPATATQPGAAAQKAGVSNNTVFGGVQISHRLSEPFSLHAAALVGYTDFENPFITNYENRFEWNYGGRGYFQYQKVSSNIRLNSQLGLEWLRQNSRIQNFQNLSGERGNSLFDDKVTTRQFFAFNQWNLEVGKWHVQTGISLNNQLLNYDRLSDSSALPGRQSIRLTPMPRLAVLYEATKMMTVFIQAARGFSPPTLAEVRPSTNNFYNLRSESGWNTEAGIKWHSADFKWQMEANIYYAFLRNTIVRQSDSSGAEFFINAGSTRQPGVESFIQGTLLDNEKTFIRKFTFSSSFTWQPYKFDTYQTSSGDFSGNRLTGVPRLMQVTSCKISFPADWNWFVMSTFTSQIPLSDANDVFAKEIFLLQSRISHQWTLKKGLVECYLGIDNLLNRKYSLGNDINAFGGRYFNPAPLRNYFLGVIFSLAQY